MDFKDFYDLEFEPHWARFSNIAAKLFFDNGYGVSVIQGGGAYTSGKSEYELAVLQGTEGAFELTYSTPITDDVLGHQTELEITNAMLAVQALDKV